MASYEDCSLPRGPRRSRHDPARPRSPHLHVGQHGPAEGRDGDSPRHGVHRGQPERVPAPPPRGADPQRPPLAFDYGLYQLFMAIRMGATLVLERSLVYPAQALKRMEEEAVTVFPGVPTVYATLVGMHEREPLPLRQRRARHEHRGGAPAELPRPAARDLPERAHLPDVRLTECKRVSYLEPELLDEKPTSVGKAIPGTETLVLDEQGKRVAPGETGVLHVRGPHVMVGYWNLPDRTAEMLVEGPLPASACSAPTTTSRSTRRASSTSWAEATTSSSRAARRSAPRRSRTRSTPSRACVRRPSSALPDELLGEAVHAYVALEEGSGLGDATSSAPVAQRLGASWSRTGPLPRRAAEDGEREDPQEGPAGDGRGRRALATGRSTARRRRRASSNRGSSTSTARTRSPRPLPRSREAR